MNDTENTFATLASAAEKEAVRLSRMIGTVDAKEELLYRVWPFLSDLVDAVQALADDEDPPTLPVDLVARVSSALLGTVQLLGQPISREQVEAIAAGVAQIVEELISLTDADELAAYCAQIQPTAAPPTVDSPASASVVTDAQPAPAEPVATPAPEGTS